MTTRDNTNSPIGVFLVCGGANSTCTTAAFNVAAGQWVYVNAYVDTNGSTQTWVPSNTGTLSAWTRVIFNDAVAGGSVVVFRAFAATAQTGITVSMTVANGGTPGDTEGSMWTDLWNYASFTQTGAATNTGISTSTNFNATLTTTVTGSQVAGIAVDDSQLNTPTSSDLFNASLSQHADGIRAYKAANSGAPGSVNLNFQATTTPQWAWATYEILPAATGIAAITEGADSVAGVGVATPVTPSLPKPLGINGPGTAGPFNNNQFKTRAPAFAAATLTATGAAAIFEGADSVAGVGKGTNTGAAGIFEGADTAVGVGSANTTGSAAILEGADAVAASGTAGAAGSASITEGTDTVAGVGNTLTAGSAAILEGSDTVAAAGTAGTGAVANITEGSDTVAASGSTITSGAASILEGTDAVAGVGTARTTGSAAILEGSDAAAGTGAAGSGGIASILEGSDTVVASGSGRLTGTAAILEGLDTAHGLGAAGTTATAAILEGADAVAGVGTATQNADTGIAAILEGSDIVVASGSTGTSGFAAINEGQDIVAGVGVAGVSGSAAILEGQDTVVAVGFAGIVLVPNPCLMVTIPYRRFTVTYEC